MCVMAKLGNESGAAPAASAAIPSPTARDSYSAFAHGGKLLLNYGVVARFIVNREIERAGVRLALALNRVSPRGLWQYQDRFKRERQCCCSNVSRAQEKIFTITASGKVDSNHQ
jgi:hypothetical protein